jgi:hypothetical protein
MEIPPGKTMATEVEVRNPTTDTIRNAYLEVDYGYGLTAWSDPLTLPPGEQTSVQVRLRNPTDFPLAIQSASVRLLDTQGRLHWEVTRTL